MSVYIVSERFANVDGTFFRHTDVLKDDWKSLRNEKDAVLVVDQGATSLALALKVWPDLRQHIAMIVYAGGTLKRGDATVWAEQTVYEDPYAVESVLNAGIPVVFALKETAEAIHMTAKELACAYAEDSSMYEVCDCGIHVEIQENAPAFGKLICDHYADHKFERQNAAYIKVNQQ